MWLLELQGFYLCEAHLFIRDFEVAQGKIFRCRKVFTVSTVTDKHFLGCCPVVFFFLVIQIIHELQFIKKTVHGFELFHFRGMALFTNQSMPISHSLLSGVKLMSFFLCVFLRPTTAQKKNKDYQGNN